MYLLCCIHCVLQAVEEPNLSQRCQQASADRQKDELLTYLTSFLHPVSFIIPGTFCRNAPIRFEME